VPSEIHVFHTARWRDPAWSGLDQIAQWLHMYLETQPQLDAAGFLPLRPDKWARASADGDTERIEAAAKLLTETGWIAVDNDTDECLLRRHISTDTVRKPYMFVAAIRAARLAESPVLRAVVWAAIQRMDIPPRKNPKDESLQAKEMAALEHVVAVEHARIDHVPNLLPNGSPYLSGNLSPNLTGNLSPREPIGDRFAEPLPDRSLELELEPESPYVGGSVGETRVRASDEPAPSDRPETGNGPHPGNPAADELPPPWCTRHPGGTDTNCRACGRAREANEHAVAQRREARKAAHRAVIDACDRCDDTGWVIDAEGKPVDPAKRCDHTVAIEPAFDPWTEAAP
jgi:hypothetical protein